MSEFPGEQMYQRRTFLTASLAALAGCASLSDETASADGYEETFERFAVTPDGRSLVVLGKRYHYVFAEFDWSLRNALQSSLKPLLTAEFKDFRIEYESRIRGRWALVLPLSQLSETQREQAKALGFKAEGSERYVLSGVISGAVHNNKNVQPPSDWQKTNSAYQIKVAGRPNPASLSRSPISVVTDGVLMLGLIILIPIFILSGRCLTCNNH